MEAPHSLQTEGKKKLKTYFWEFLMLFLAVFLGFFSEYKLEHVLEKDEEKEFMSSMIKDLGEDIISLNKVSYGNTVILQGLDTLLTIMEAPENNDMYKKNLFLYSVKYTYEQFIVDFSELTLEQLKNSGGYRLIKNKKVANAIADYNLGLESCKHQREELIRYFHVLEDTQKEIINTKFAKQIYNWFEKDIMNMLAPNDQLEKFMTAGQYILPDAYKHLSRQYADILFYAATLRTLNDQYKLQQQKAASLTDLIQKNYNLKS